MNKFCLQPPKYVQHRFLSRITSPSVMTSEFPSHPPVAKKLFGRNFFGKHFGTQESCDKFILLTRCPVHMQPIDFDWDSLTCHMHLLIFGFFTNLFGWRKDGICPRNHHNSRVACTLCHPCNLSSLTSPTSTDAHNNQATDTSWCQRSCMINTVMNTWYSYSAHHRETLQIFPLY